MSKGPRLAEIGPCLTMKGLQQALDYAYRHLLETAKADWQRLFASNDRVHAPINVRRDIAEELAGTARAGRIPPKRKRAISKTRRRLA